VTASKTLNQEYWSCNISSSNPQAAQAASTAQTASISSNQAAEGADNIPELTWLLQKSFLIASHSQKSNKSTEKVRQ
jgi:hypothetical protein